MNNVLALPLPRPTATATPQYNNKIINMLK